MPGAKKKQSGCWTCRLRRKKCDRARPACRTCSALEITCHNGSDKPEWLDGATKQREMVERFKNQIKNGSSRRRNYQITKAGHRFIIVSEQDYADELPTEGRVTPPEEGTSTCKAAEESSGSNPGGITSAATMPPVSLVQADLEESSSLPHGSYSIRRPELSQTILNLAGDRPRPHSVSRISSFPRAWEMDFIMMYLDYVLPVLFPFYHPPLAGTGRSWLLTFLTQSDAIYYSVISMSSYFFTVGLNEAYPGKHENCKSLVWDQVLKQADLSFEMIQHDLAVANRPGVQNTLLEKARLMESIIQMLIFELFLGKSTNWATHLSPALALFEEMYKKHTLSLNTKPVLLRILEELSWPSDNEVDFGRIIWNPDQAAFRFFTAILITLDIVAATSLEQAPRLRNYHSYLLGDVQPDEVSVPIDLSAFVGCQNWALLSVGSVAALHAWKKEMKGKGSLSVPELVERAQEISQTLDGGLSRLQSTRSSNARNNNRLQPYYHHARLISSEISLTATRVWACAARIYLEVVVSGWQPSNTKIQQNSEEVLSIIENMETADHARALAWPICIAGCVAETGVRERFNKITARIGDQQTSSSIREAWEIMNSVWSYRESTDREAWDIAACFRILGSPALLF